MHSFAIKPMEASLLNLPLNYLLLEQNYVCLGFKKGYNLYNQTLQVTSKRIYI